MYKADRLPDRVCQIYRPQFLHIQSDHFLLDTTDALAMAITHAQELTTTGGFGVPKPL